MAQPNDAPDMSISDGLRLTDANMAVYNDCPQPITLTVDNNRNMSTSFPSPNNIGSGGVVTGSVKAGNWPAQSYFDVSFWSGEKMHVLLGTGFYDTNATPEYLSGGKGGAVLAPGKPFSTGTDYSFLFFNGPGVLPALINSAIQANLPAIISYISSNPITITVSDSVSLTISSLQVDPSSVQCTYAAILPKSGGTGNLWNLNAIMRVGQGTMAGSQTIQGHTGSVFLSVSGCLLHVQAQVDLTFQTKPQVTALQMSLGDYNLSGGIVQILKDLFPLIAQLFAMGASAYRVAGAINNNFNQTIINAINSTIANTFGMPDITRGFDSGLTHGLLLASSLLSCPRPETTRLSLRSSDINPSTWMSSAQIQAKTLGQIKLPGTHDSATYDLSSTLSQIRYPEIQFLWDISAESAPNNGKWPISIPPTTSSPIYVGQALYDYIMGQGVDSISRTQDMTILQQLQAGIRHFDFRVYYDDRDDTFYTQHALRGPRFDDVLSQISSFITSNPKSSELIFAAISHTNFKDHPEQIPVFANLCKTSIQPQNIFYQATPSGQNQFDFQSLANSTLSSITAGATKVMFLDGDWSEYTYSDTITNTSGYAGVPWDGEKYTVDELITQQGPGLDNHSEALWSVGWVLGADTPTIVQNILTLFTGVQKWALQNIAAQANAGLPAFLNQHGGSSGKFNLVTVDWFEYGASPSVPEYIIGMN